MTRMSESWKRNCYARLLQKAKKEWKRGNAAVAGEEEARYASIMKEPEKDTDVPVGWDPEFRRGNFVKDEVE